jgi:hypothetical protein
MHFQVVDFLCNCAFCDTLATTGNFFHRDDYHLWTLPRIEHSIMLRPDEESPGEQLITRRRPHPSA